MISIKSNQSINQSCSWRLAICQFKNELQARTPFVTV